jgi:5-methylcytosine-specific restriction endonuclease McrA
LKHHTKIYLSYFPEPKCEGCGAYAQSMGQFILDVHHIERRGMGSTSKDFIENLMGLCRKCHEKYGDKKQFKSWLYRVHKQKLEETGKAFDDTLIDELINAN